MTTAPRVSVVVPTYNEEAMIGGCIDSLLAQTVVPHEIIVVDNNSTDATKARLRQYGDRIVVLDERRQGVHHASSAGMDAATGEIIGRIDADSRLPVTWIAEVQRLLADRAVQAVTGPARYYDILLPKIFARLDLVVRESWLWAAGQDIDWIFGANMAVRASAWRAVRDLLCHDERIHEDLDFGIHLYNAGLRISFVRSLSVGASSRRIRSTFRDYRAYLRMTEEAYASHRSLAHRHSYRRAWITNQVLALTYWPCRALHEAYLARHPEQGFLHSIAGTRSRKNPMSAISSCNDLG